MFAPMPPPILLLDVMGTLVHDPFAREMPAFFGMSLERLLDEKHPTAWVEFERGELDETTFLARFFADGRDFDAAGFVDHVEASYRFLDGIPTLLDALREAGVEMHALSNYPTWYRRIERRLGLSRWVPWTFVSCRTGVRKPHPEAYLGAARALGVDPGDCLFVDDREANVAAARGVGMAAHHFTGAGALRDALARHGVPVPEAAG